MSTLKEADMETQQKATHTTHLHGQVEIAGRAPDYQLTRTTVMFSLFVPRAPGDKAKDFPMRLT